MTAAARRIALIAWACGMFGPAPAFAQSPIVPDRGGTPMPPTRTTLTGVYTAPQAERGKDVYLAQCASCHAAITHTGPVFRRNWSGRPLAALYTFMSTRMPKSDPASLSPETYADLLAYMLQMNQMPPGGTELPPDVEALQQVRIQLAAPPKRAKR